MNSKASDLKSCYLCHPGPVTQCKRGAMNAQLCFACHGNPTKAEASTRTGWLDVPSCQMCHNNRLRYTSTFDKKRNGRQTKDLTFATNPSTPKPAAARAGICSNLVELFPGEVSVGSKPKSLNQRKD